MVLFGLSDGINSDKEVTEDILSMVSDTERVDTVMYGGDTDAVKTEFSKCSFVICTRFHAIVTCLSMNIPFIPVSYEVKTKHLLEDIGYKGVRFDYKEMAGLAEAVEKIASYTDSSVAPDLYDKDMFNEYISGSGRKLSELKEKLNAPACTDAISKEFDTESPYTEVIYGKKEGEIVTRRKAREKEILDAMDSYVSTIEKLKADVEEHVETINKLNDENKGLFTQIEEANDRNSELFKTIEETNARNAEYFKIIEEVNARNAECNKTIEELNAKLDVRPAFLKNLNKNNKS